MQKEKKTYSMGVNPDESSIRKNARSARKSPQPNRMIPTQCQRQRPPLQLSLDRPCDRLCDRRDVTGVQQFPHRWVGSRTELGVVAVAVEVDGPTEFFELVQESKLDDLDRSMIDSFTFLFCIVCCCRVEEG